MLRRALLAAFLTALSTVSAVAQNVPTTLPKNSLVGRLGVNPGPPQVIPFDSLWAVAPFQPIGSSVLVRCHGIDDSDALNSARIAAIAGSLTIQLPVGTCITNSSTALEFTSGSVTINGYGRGISILKAKNSARLVYIVASGATSKLRLTNLTLDGNRAGFGLRTSAVSAAFSTTASFSQLDNVEIKESALNGVIGFSPATDLSINNSYFHDIGTNEVLSNNIASGIFTGNAVARLNVTNSIFNDIHPTVTPLGDSNAINVTVSSSYIAGNSFLNNYNVNGAQIAVSDNSDGQTAIESQVVNNIIRQTGRFDTDHTACIEVNGSIVIVTGNLCVGMANGGILTEGTIGAYKVVIAHNIIQDYNIGGFNAAAISLTGAPGITTVDSNIIQNGQIGIFVANVGGTGGNIALTNNQIVNTVTPISGIANVTRSLNNLGYNPVGVTAAATVGASPATICAGPSPETHYFLQSATNTATITLAGNLAGTTASVTVPVVIQLGPKECEVVTWVTTAPTYVKSVH